MHPYFLDKKKLFSSSFWESQEVVNTFLTKNKQSEKPAAKVRFHLQQESVVAPAFSSNWCKTQLLVVTGRFSVVVAFFCCKSFRVNLKTFGKLARKLALPNTELLRTFRVSKQRFVGENTQKKVWMHIVP